MSKKIFIDTETTGVDRKRSGIYQIAGIIECDGKTKEFDFKCNIFENDIVDKKIFELSKISLDEIANYPDPEDAFKEFTEMLGKYVNRFDKNDKFTAIGYFADFDAEMLRTWFSKNNDKFFGSWFWHPWIDVSQLVAYISQDDRHLFPNFKLSTVAKLLGLVDKDDEQYHDAMFDVRVTRDMYWKMDKILRGE